MPNNALASQLKNLVTMYSFKIVDERMQCAWNECDPQLIEELYEVWNDLIVDVCNFVPADNV
jgi:hypothetical protein